MEMNFSVYCHISPSGKRYISVNKDSWERVWRSGTVNREMLSREVQESREIHMEVCTRIELNANG